MKRALFCIFLILWINASNAQSIITIDVQENGTAFWDIEKRLPLTSQADKDDWSEFILKGQGQEYENDTSDFRERIEWFLQSAKNYTGRPMSTKNLRISYNTTKTLSGDFGTIHYSFDWNRFSKVESKKIFIGDIFSEGMLLSGDNILIISIPGGYEVTGTIPNYDKRDGNRLIWDGTLYRSFKKGEPSLVLTKTSPVMGTWFMVGLLAFLFGGSSMIFLKRKWGIGGIGSKAEKPLPLFTEEDLQYEDMVSQILVKSGGQAFQSDIVEQIGVSKSKISVVIAKMKEEGRIVKIRKGKENLIRFPRK